MKNSFEEIDIPSFKLGEVVILPEDIDIENREFTQQVIIISAYYRNIEDLEDGEENGWVYTVKTDKDENATMHYFENINENELITI